MGAWYSKSRATGFVQSHRVHRGDRKLVYRSSLGEHHGGGGVCGGVRFLTPSLYPNPHLASGAPLNCSRGRSAFKVSASWWV